MAKKQPKFTWDPERGVAKCTVYDGENEFTGVAQCCEADRDMMSEKTGCEIALRRAEIKYYLHIKNNEIIPGLKSLKQLYSNLEHSSHSNENGYEMKMVRRHIRRFESDLAMIKEMIAYEKLGLKTMLIEKEMFYKRIRANRAKQEDSVGQD